MNTAATAPEVKPEDVTPKATASQYLAAMLGAIAQYRNNEQWCRAQGKLAQQCDRGDDATTYYRSAAVYAQQITALTDAIGFAEGTS